MNFPGTSVKAAFLIRFTLASESTSFDKKTIKNFVTDFYQNFLPPVKRVHSFNIFYFKVKPIFIPRLS